LNDEEGIFELNKEPYCGCYQWVRDGIPLSYDVREEGVICLFPDIAKAIDKSELDYLLTKNVITDAATIQILKDRGFDLGVKVKMLTESERPLVMRSFAEDGSGRLHGMGGFIPGDDRAGLIYPNKDMEILAFVDADVNKLPPITADREFPHGVAECIVKTPKGAKWAIFGFALWNGVVTSTVIKHILDTADYISDNSLAARLLTPIQAVLLPRKNNDGKTVCVSVTNCTIGKSGEISLLIRNPRSESFKFMSQYNGESSLDFAKQGDDYILKLPSLEPWSVGTVFIE